MSQDLKPELFDITQLPTKFPPLSELKLWIYPEEERIKELGHEIDC